MYLFHIYETVSVKRCNVLIVLYLDASHDL